MIGEDRTPHVWRTTADGTRWLRTYLGVLEYIEKRNGVDWIDAPLPPRWHRCKAQVRGLLDGPIARCACGGISQDGHHWLERNSRRKP